MTQVSDVMTHGVRTMAPTDTLQAAAQAMDELNVGSMPVCTDERLVGMVTDRDITVRGVAQGRAPATTQLHEVMSEHVRWCFEDQSIDEVMRQMTSSQIRRLPVVDRGKRLVGMLSLGDIAVRANRSDAAMALAAVSEPAEPDLSGAALQGGAAIGESSRAAV